MKPAPLIATAALGAVLASPFQDLLGSPGLEVDVVSIPLAQMRQHQQGVHQGAHPRDFVLITEGTTYTVPDGKLLVIRQWFVSQGGDSSGPSSFTLYKDGVVHIQDPPKYVFDSNPVEPGLVYEGGTAVHVAMANHVALATGYLVDA